MDIARTTLFLALFVYYLMKIFRFFYKHGLRGSKKLAMRTAYDLAKRTIAKDSIDQQMQEIRVDLEQKLIPNYTKVHINNFIPETSTSKQVIIEKFEKWSAAHRPLWNGEKTTCSGTVYHGGKPLQEFLNQCYGMFSMTNPLHPDVFPFVRKMEAEIIQMTLGAMHGGEDACGILTSGGTESIICAIRTYRNWARRVKGITSPELIIPETAHAAFDKACEMLCIEPIYVPVHPTEFTLEPEKVRKAISNSTIAIVASAPSYPQGVLDPINEIAQIATQHNVGLHVDSCLGSFLLCFLPQLGYDIPTYDFRVPGVTSISLDTHKYGFAPKGSSVLCYNSTELRRHGYFIMSQWTGGLYATPTIQGSRSGGIVASTWAAIMAMGQDGYVECCKEIMEEVEIIKEGIKTMPELKIQGNPISSVVAFDSIHKDVNIYAVATAMDGRGWALNKLQNPAGVHVAVTKVYVNRGAKFIKALREVVTEIQKTPEDYQGGEVALYGTMASLPEGIRDEVLDQVLGIYWDVLLKTH